jgi:hypothetical protein
MDANLILIDDDAEFARARALVETLWDSEAPADVARLRARALLIAAYEESRWPPRPPNPPNPSAISCINTACPAPIWSRRARRAA